MKQQTKTKMLRWLAVPALTVALSACGGGSSGDDSTDGGLGEDVALTDPNGDVDGDGVPNFQDVDQTQGTDADFDGIDDQFDPDFGGADTNDPNGDNDNDGVPNFQDVDFTNGPDEDFDGIDDTQQITDVNGGGGDLPPIVDLGPCEGTNGDDPISINDDWGDNCELSDGNVHAESSYTRGVQRILICLGYPLTEDADFGPQTASAVMDFQSDNPPLAVDGFVGPQTWRALRDTLEGAPLDITIDVYSVAFYDPDGDDIDNRLPVCDNQAQFFQTVDGGTLLGWEMAQEPGSLIRVPFSTGF